MPVKDASGVTNIMVVQLKKQMGWRVNTHISDMLNRSYSNLSQFQRTEIDLIENIR